MLKARKVYNTLFVKDGKEQFAQAHLVLTLDDGRTFRHSFIASGSTPVTLNKDLMNAKGKLLFEVDFFKERFTIETAIPQTETTVKQLFKQALEQEINDPKSQFKQLENKVSAETDKEFQILDASNSALTVLYGSQTYEVTPETISNTNTGKQLSETSAPARFLRSHLAAHFA